MTPVKSPLRTLGSKALFYLFGTLPLTTAVPYPRDSSFRGVGLNQLMPRQCATYCGWNNQICCEAGTECYTVGDFAGCSSTAGGGWIYYTTVWTVTKTKTYTSIYSSWISYFPATTATAVGEDCIPPEGSGWIACGPICCAAWQYCASKGQCLPNAGYGAGGEIITSTLVSDGVTITTQFSAPYRVTSGTGGEIPPPTATGEIPEPTDDPEAVEGGGGGLSGGAIAGIVIGTIAGVGLLLMLCACCIMRGIWRSIGAIFHLIKKKTKRSSTSNVEGGRTQHDSWYGGKPSSSAVRKEKAKGAGLIGLGAALGGLALLLGLRRDKQGATPAASSTRSPRSETTISSGYISYYTSSSGYPSSYPCSLKRLMTNLKPGSSSSDRRTRSSTSHSSHSRSHIRSHHSGSRVSHSRHGSQAGSRGTRTTYTHTRVSHTQSQRSHRLPRD